MLSLEINNKSLHTKIYNSDFIIQNTDIEMGLGDTNSQDAKTKNISIFTKIMNYIYNNI